MHQMVRLGIASVLLPAAVGLFPSVAAADLTAPATLPAVSLPAPSLPVANPVPTVAVVNPVPSVPVVNAPLPSVPVVNAPLPSVPVVNAPAPSVPVVNAPAPSLPVVNAPAPSTPKVGDGTPVRQSGQPSQPSNGGGSGDRASGSSPQAGSAAGPGADAPSAGGSGAGANASGPAGSSAPREVTWGPRVAPMGAVNAMLAASVTPSGLVRPGSSAELDEYLLGLVHNELCVALASMIGPLPAQINGLPSSVIRRLPADVLNVVPREVLARATVRCDPDLATTVPAPAEPNTRVLALLLAQTGLMVMTAVQLGLGLLCVGVLVRHHGRPRRVTALAP